MKDEDIGIKLFLVIFFIFGVVCIFWFNSPSQQISGVVAEVEYDVKSSSSLFGSHETKHTIVKFEDGRVKVFNNIRGIIYEGKFNTIHYNRDGGIVCVKIK